MTKRKSFILFFFIFLISGGILFPAHAFSDLSNEELKTILAIGEVRDNLTGANLLLISEPDQYYHEVGSEIMLSGSLKGVFGPLANYPILIEQLNQTNASKFLQSETDQQGMFSVTDILSERGTFTYQAIIDHDVYIETDPVKSNKIEISAGLLKDTEFFNHSEFNKTSDTIQILSPLQSENISITLTTNSTSFIPGDLVFFSGNLTSDNGPIPYARVQITYETWGEQATQGIIDERLTKSNGTVNFNYHLPGPDPVVISLEYPDRQNGQLYNSEKLVLIPEQMGINPPPRILHKQESIEIFLDNESVESVQNITIYGWYNAKEGINQSISTLELMWYNFGEKMWDNYQNSSKILTNTKGKFDCTIQAPQTTGTYLIAVKKPGNTTKSQVFSNILPLTVTSQELEKDEQNESFETIDLLLEGYPSPIQVSEKLEIVLKLETEDQMMIAKSSPFLYYSNNGQEWVLFKNENIVFDSEGKATFTIYPDIPGYWYFRGVLENDIGPIGNSNILVIPVIDGNT